MYNEVFTDKVISEKEEIKSWSKIGGEVIIFKAGWLRFHYIFLTLLCNIFEIFYNENFKNIHQESKDV